MKTERGGGESDGDAEKRERKGKKEHLGGRGSTTAWLHGWLSYSPTLWQAQSSKRAGEKVQGRWQRTTVDVGGTELDLSLGSHMPKWLTKITDLTSWSPYP